MSTNFANPNVKVVFTPAQTHKKKTTEKDESEKVNDEDIRKER